MKNKKIKIVTMQKVATLAGVSIATVSRALTNPDKVAFTTRNKIGEVIQEIGYILPHQYRLNKKNNAKVILVIFSAKDPSFIEVLKGIEEVALQQGYLILLSQYPIQRNELKLLIVQQQISGVIILDPEQHYILNEELIKQLPYTTLSFEFSPPAKIPSVHIDNLTSAFTAVDYLYKLGHTRIACLSGPQHLLSCKYRQQGYIQALNRKGIAIENRYILENELTFEAGVQAFKYFMQLPQAPTAIFCHSDLTAIGVISAAKNIGLQIPQDLSIIGFNNLPISSYVDPPLTTIAQPYQEIGRTLISILINKAQGQFIKKKAIVLESKLLIRKTTDQVTKKAGQNFSKSVI